MNWDEVERLMAPYFEVVDAARLMPDSSMLDDHEAVAARHRDRTGSDMTAERVAELEADMLRARRWARENGTTHHVGRMTL